MKFIIKRRDDGHYVAGVGDRSYTKELSKARTFPSWDAADKERCENETVCRADNELLPVMS